MRRHGSVCLLIRLEQIHPLQEVIINTHAVAFNEKGGNGWLRNVPTYILIRQGMRTRPYFK